MGNTPSGKTGDVGKLAALEAERNVYIMARVGGFLKAYDKFCNLRKTAERWG